MRTQHAFDHSSLNIHTLIRHLSFVIRHSPLALSLTFILLPTLPLRADWKTDADARIEQHRKSDFTLQITYNGQPLGKHEVAVRQTESTFHFGTAVSGWMLVPANDAFARRNQTAYLGYVAARFNTVVAENDMKWYAVEKDRDKLTFDHADALVKFASEHGLALRGHCLFWSKQKYIHRTPWVETLANDDLWAAIDRHIADIVGRYKGKVIAWDVNNEMLDGSWYKDRLGDLVRPHMFDKARQVDPDAPLFTNEYMIMDSDERTAKYVALIKELQAKGAPIGGIGIQEHAAERFAAGGKPELPDPEHPERQVNAAPLDLNAVYARLDKIAALGLPIHLTELSFKTADETRRADAVENCLRLAFSHPKVEAVLFWGFWVNAHFLGPTAALVDEDWHNLPAGDRYDDLVFKQWRTKATLATDEAGVARFRGFHGTYQIHVTIADPDAKPGDTRKTRSFDRTIRLTATQPAATLRLSHVPPTQPASQPATQATQPTTQATQPATRTSP